jgi:hypothetical protein
MFLLTLSLAWKPTVVFEPPTRIGVVVMKNQLDIETKKGCCDGNVVEVSGNRLTYTGEQGDEHQTTIAKDAKITCNGKKGSLADLEEGSAIRMTMCQDDKNKVVAIDCGAQRPERSNH